MNQDLLRQRINYLLEHGGVYPVRARRLATVVACAASFLAGAFLDDSDAHHVCFNVPHVWSCSGSTD
jgi:hypothetical protein